MSRPERLTGVQHPRHALYGLWRQVISREWLGPSLLLLGMLIPVWIGLYPPLVDYPNHLLEAQIVTHYADPQFGYSKDYEIRPGWYLESNALTALLIIGLGRVMPVALAGRLVLSLYLALLLVGLGLLLWRAGALWPLLWIAPILAYNFIFISGVLNFSYSLALGLFAVVVFLRWQETGRRRDLVLLAILFFFIYFAHVLAWALFLVAIAAMAGVGELRLQRHGLLFLAMNAALPLLLLTRPALGVVALLIAPGLWASMAFVRRLHPRPALVALGVVAIVYLGYKVIPELDNLWRVSFPDTRYVRSEKRTFPLRLFTLIHQFDLPVEPLTIYNLALLILVFTLAGLLVWSSFREAKKRIAGPTAALGLLAILYTLLPSRTREITLIEPRILLVATVVALAAVRLPPPGSRLRSAITVCALALGLLGVGGTTLYAYGYDQRAHDLRAQLDRMWPGRSILVLGEHDTAVESPIDEVLFENFNTVRTGFFFNTVYAVERGGFISNVFDNGPVRPQPHYLVPLYYWPPFDNTRFVAEQCSELRTTYDTVLVWGTFSGELEAELDACFGEGHRLDDMGIWRVNGRGRNPG